MASSAGDKQRAASYIEQHLLPDTRAAGRIGEGGGPVQPPLVAGAARSSLLKPDTGLKGLSAWAADKGLSEAMAVWQGQTNGLLNRLNRELDALRGTNTLFRGQDVAIGEQFGSTRGTQSPSRSRINEW
ncbi:hypothetical protein B7P34_16710 [Streptosporangium nondiastaticum]|uniref:Uncharacterized protein n=2 Tax=Streptosporangium nondiastaticum TaxID=35764 RepID=A0A9X7PH42_9ACTN|nr:hypothetical protein B7P34_16710 [Streptosporangium nondiastaticum]